MNAELKAKWIAALRSGEYQQGRGQLRRIDNTYCCLGVLCEVAGLKAELNQHNDYSYLGNSLFEPPVFDIPSYISRNLMVMNDNGKPFAEIADYIERETDLVD